MNDAKGNMMRRRRRLTKKHTRVFKSMRSCKKTKRMISKDLILTVNRKKRNNKKKKVIQQHHESSGFKERVETNSLMNCIKSDTISICRIYIQKDQSHGGITGLEWKNRKTFKPCKRTEE